jgi:hypothetical protein
VILLRSELANGYNFYNIACLFAIICPFQWLLLVRAYGFNGNNTRVIRTNPNTPIPSSITPDNISSFTAKQCMAVLLTNYVPVFTKADNNP